jgi:phosphoribosylanthranilate isomerase
VRVKICGVCRPQDAATAAAAGADYIGVILGARSPRLRSAAEAEAVYAAAPGCRRVGVFADRDVAAVAALAERLSLDVVQLHGAEPPVAVAELLRRGPWTVWKAVRARAAADFLGAVDAYGASVGGLLIDGWTPDAAGGAGVRAPWETIGPLRERVPWGVDFIAAGGLRPDNVAAAIAALSPDVVDVSSGVEAQPGEKSAERVRAFVSAARTARRTEPDRTEA